MRNYWLRIAMGAVAIFAVGMVGITLARQGVGRVRGVVEGTGPISVPLAFVPFKLDGQRLGTVNKLVLHRETPKQISSVELEIKLADSAVARGLEGCRLLANFNDERPPHRNNIEVGPLSTGVFSCLHGDDSTGQFQDFGHAVLQPGDISVPLLLPNDIVDDLKRGDFGSNDGDATGTAEAAADSIAEAADAKADSIAEAAEKRADLMVARTQRLVDSLRTEGLRRADSARGVRSSNHRVHGRIADSARSR
jgi:hypothetical protein